MPKISPTKRTEETKIIADLAGSIAGQMNIHTKDAETFFGTFTDIVSGSLAAVSL